MASVSRMGREQPRNLLVSSSKSTLSMAGTPEACLQTATDIFLGPFWTLKYITGLSDGFVTSQ